MELQSNTLGVSSELRITDVDSSTDQSSAYYTSPESPLIKDTRPETIQSASINSMEKILIKHFSGIILNHYRCRIRKDPITDRCWFELSALLCKFSDNQALRRRWYKALSIAHVSFGWNKITLARVENLDLILNGIGATDEISQEIIQYKSKHAPEFDENQDYTDCPFTTQQTYSPIPVRYDTSPTSSGLNVPSKKRQRSQEELLEPDIVTPDYYESNQHNPLHYERTMPRNCYTCRKIEIIPRPLDRLYISKHNKFQCNTCYTHTQFIE